MRAYSSCGAYTQGCSALEGTVCCGAHDPPESGCTQVVLSQANKAGLVTELVSLSTAKKSNYSDEEVVCNLQRQANKSLQGFVVVAVAVSKRCSLQLKLFTKEMQGFGGVCIWEAGKGLA